jgi:hypothetical protein
MEQSHEPAEAEIRVADPPAPSPSMGHIVVWIVALVALGMVGGAWRSSLTGMEDQAAIADVESFEEGVEAFGAAVSDGDPFLAESHLQTLLGLTANPATKGDPDLEAAWRYAFAVTGRASDGDLTDPEFAAEVASELQGASERLRHAFDG